MECSLGYCSWCIFLTSPKEEKSWIIKNVTKTAQDENYCFNIFTCIKYYEDDEVDALQWWMGSPLCLWFRFYLINVVVSRNWVGNVTVGVDAWISGSIGIGGWIGSISVASSVGSVRICDVADTSGSNGSNIGVSAIGIWVCDATDTTSGSGISAISVPRWVATMGQVVLLSSLLILLDLGDNASSQSYQNQQALVWNK